MSETVVKKRQASRFGWLYVLVCLAILVSCGSGWLLTGRIMRLHEAAQLTFNYALRGFGPTWQQIMCVKAWEKTVDRSGCAA